MNLKAFLPIILLFGSSFALANSETKSPEACETALGAAEEKLKEIVQRDRGTTRTSSNNSTGSASSNPIAQLMQKQAETEGKRMDLEVKHLEEMNKIKNEEFNQRMQLQDKIHEYRRGEYNRRQEIVKAEQERRAAHAAIRVECRQQSRKRYNDMLAVNRTRAGATRFETQSTGAARGTRFRMKQQRNVFYSECMSDPETLEKQKLADDALTTKMQSYKVKAEEIAADIQYTENKIPQLEAQMQSQRDHVNKVTDMRREALEQQAQTQRMAMMMQALTIATSQGQRNESAANFSSAQQALDNMDQIRNHCMNSNLQARGIEVPRDVIQHFERANRVCPATRCASSNGAASEPTRLPTSSQSIQ